MRTYQFRLYPTKHQFTLFKEQLDIHKNLYNQCLEHKINQYKLGNNISCFELIKLMIPDYKGQSNYSSMQQTVRRLDKAYNAFFKKNSKFPRFKKRFRTINFSKYGDGCKLGSNYVYIQYVGKIKMQQHRQLPCKPTTLSITLKGENVYVNITCECLTTIKSKNIKSVGIDFGIKTTISTSDGKQFVTPYFKKMYKTELNKLRRKEKWKAYSKVHKKIANRRKDFNHKLSLHIVKNYDTICLEDLQVEEIVSDFESINQRLYDIGINQLISFITYKAESAGKSVIMVNPNNTTKTCSNCGKINNISLTQRIYKCDCGLKINRDLNAATNILTRGLASLA